MIWIHIAWTTVLLATFIAIVLWAWSGKQKGRFREAERIPLEDDETASGSVGDR